jgi:hypothetical protein
MISTKLEIPVKSPDSRISVIDSNLSKCTLASMISQVYMKYKETYGSNISKQFDLGSALLVLIICHFHTKLVSS